MRRARRESPYTKRHDETPEEYRQRLNTMHEEEAAEARRIVAAETARILEETRTRAPRTPHERNLASIQRTQTLPRHIRLNIAARRLANAGAMTPEGCLITTMGDVRHRYDLDGGTVKEIMGNLWELRMLGWFPGDTAYLNYTQVTDIVSRKAERPKDTIGLVPKPFAERHPEDLAALRYGREARLRAES